MSPMTLPRAAAERLSSAWSARRTQPGWLLLPLRAFLGITFVYAGLQKLANPAYLDPHSPSSVLAQMRALQSQSPIGPLVSLSSHAPTLVGVLIAVGELAVGVGTLLGLWTRVAAAGGAALALSFFLTVSWSTTPYYYGSDIVFVFAWAVLIAFGAGGVLSVDGWLRNRARAATGLGPEPAVIALPASRVRALCARGAKCGLAPDGVCSRLRGCPIFPTAEQIPPARRAELDRRVVLASGMGVAGAAVLTAVLAGLTAAIGRLRNTGGTALGAPTSVPTGHPSATQVSSGTVIAQASALAVGQAKMFNDPKSQQPAWLVHTSGNAFAAFSAICTHAGCTVDFDASTTAFVCPCHGGTFDARTGKVLQGPPPAPLAAIAVQVTGGSVRVG